MDIIRIRELLKTGKNIYELPLRVVYYARVSTDKYEQQNSLQNQTGYYEEFIRSNSAWTFSGSYVDEGLSGTSTKHRTEFIRMIGNAKLGLFDLIITKEISRFSRNTLDSIKYTRELLNCGVGVLFQSDNINTLESDSELRLTIMASIAQDEVRKISERVRFGLTRAQENGVVLGRDNMFGYAKENGRLTIEPKEADVVRRIFEEYVDSGYGLRRLARKLEEEGILSPCGQMFSYSTLHGIITNPKYKGVYAGRKSVSIDYRSEKRIGVAREDWLTYESENIPAIVEPEIWETANALLQKRGGEMRADSKKYCARYKYSGKIICAEHNSAYHRHVYKSKRSGEKEVWNCRLYRLKGKEQGCDSPTLYTFELDAIMREVYADLKINLNNAIDGLLELYSVQDEQNALSLAQSQAKREVQTLIRRKEKLFELVADDAISNKEYKELNQKVTAQLDAAQARFDQATLALSGTMSRTERLNAIRKRLLEIPADRYDSAVSGIMLNSIIVHKKPDKDHLLLEIRLTDSKVYTANVDKERGTHSILLPDIGISQAQVSRLEKNALKQMRKHVV